MPFLNDAVLGIIFAVVAGIMVFISFDELLPGAQKYGNHHIPTYGVVIGMAIMAFSLLLLH
jgi:ZIP family zinc transporter